MITQTRVDAIMDMLQQNQTLLAAASNAQAAYNGGHRAYKRLLVAAGVFLLVAAGASFMGLQGAGILMGLAGGMAYFALTLLISSEGYLGVANGYITRADVSITSITLLTHQLSDEEKEELSQRLADQLDALSAEINKILEEAVGDKEMDA